MKDTCAEMQARYYSRVAALTPEERGRIVAETVDEIRRIVRGQLAHLPEPERSVAFLRRLYGRDLEPELLGQVERILMASRGA